MKGSISIFWTQRSKKPKKKPRNIHKVVSFLDSCHSVWNDSKTSLVRITALTHCSSLRGSSRLLPLLLWTPWWPWSRWSPWSLWSPWSWLSLNLKHWHWAFRIFLKKVRGKCNGKCFLYKFWWFFIKVVSGWLSWRNMSNICWSGIWLCDYMFTCFNSVHLYQIRSLLCLHFKGLRMSLPKSSGWFDSIRD